MTPSHADEFVRLLREHLEPVLLAAGFVFNEVVAGAGPVTAPLGRESDVRRLSPSLRRRHAGKASASAMTTTSVLYEADAQVFAAAYPGSQERPAEPDCKDLWLHYDVATGAIDIDLQGEDMQLSDSGGMVNDPTRSLEERVVALTEAIERFLAETSAAH